LREGHNLGHGDQPVFCGWEPNLKKGGRKKKKTFGTCLGRRVRRKKQREGKNKDKKEVGKAVIKAIPSQSRVAKTG